MENNKNILSVKNAKKHFGGVIAIDDVSINASKGNITGLIGPNGAGKTTLFNLITGLIAPSSGEFFLFDKKYSPKNIHNVVENGIARTFQNIRLFNKMSVLENVLVGRHVKTDCWSLGILSSIVKSRNLITKEAEEREFCMKILERVGLSEKKFNLSESLPYGDQRRLEIARALASEPLLLALDEPAAGMNPTEKVELKNLINQISKEGISILIIEHDVKLITSLCDIVYVMDRGKIISQGTPEVIKNDEVVINAYLGKNAND